MRYADLPFLFILCHLTRFALPMQHCAVALRIHGPPESGVAVGGQVSIMRQAFPLLGLPLRVVARERSSATGAARSRAVHQ
jgi:hypothetical protein